MTPTIAIIVPYCNRREHLALSLPIILDYDENARPWVIVVEQVRSMCGKRELHPFNRGLLCNLGARIAMEMQPDIGLICFHDVDMTPIDPAYDCEAARPASLVGERGHNDESMEPTPPGFFGGVVVFRRADLLNVGGFSNQYWGWGDEDIDLRMRVEWAGLEIDQRDSRFLHREHPPAVVRQELLANHRRLGLTQDRKIKPVDDGLATMPTLAPKKIVHTAGGAPDRPTLITHAQFAVDRDEIEKERAKIETAAAAEAEADTAAILDNLGISPE